MQPVSCTGFHRFPEPQHLTVFENGMYCNGCGQPVLYFDGAGKAEVWQALLLYFQTPCITGFGRASSEPLTEAGHFPMSHTQISKR